MSGQVTGAAPAIDAFYDSVDLGSSNGYCIFSVSTVENIRFNLSDPAFAAYSGSSKTANAFTWVSTAGVSGDIDLVEFFDSDDQLCYSTTSIGITSSFAFVLPKMEWATASEVAAVSSGTVG